MHELSIATGVFDSVVKTAKNNNAISVSQIDLVVGTSAAIIEEALTAAFDALKDLPEYSLCKKTKINLETKISKSICLDCGAEFSHGVGAAQCPNCESYKTQVVEGSDIYIDKIKVDLED